MVLSACSMIQIPRTITQHQAQHQFIEALDEFSETNRVSLLKQLQLDYPDGVWYTRAETIILTVQELENRKRQVENLRQEKLELQQHLQRLENDLSLLQADNQQMNEKLEQLKSVLIDLEQRKQ
jgi:chromosome segregation ATPase